MNIKKEDINFIFKLLISFICSHMKILQSLFYVLCAVTNFEDELSACVMLSTKYNRFPIFSTCLLFAVCHNYDSQNAGLVDIIKRAT